MSKMLKQVWKALVIGLPSAVLIIGFAFWVEAATGASVSALGLLSNAILPLLIGAPVILGIENRRAKLRKATMELDALRQESTRFDDITGAYSHKHFMEQITQAADEHDGSMIVFDVDNFKQLNEQYGTAQGEAALIEVVNAVQKMIRGHDAVGRMGGEEFAVFLRHASKEEARIVASRICQSVESIEFRPRNGVKTPLTVSVGLAMKEEAGNVVSAMRLADMRMYKAKARGQNKVVYSGEESSVLDAPTGTG